MIINFVVRIYDSTTLEVHHIYNTSGACRPPEVLFRQFITSDMFASRTIFSQTRSLQITAQVSNY